MVLVRDPEFENSKTEVKLEAWKAFVLVVKIFLGNNKANNCAERHQYADCFQKPWMQHEHQSALLILTYGLTS